VFKPETLARLRKIARKNEYMRRALRKVYRFIEYHLARFLVALRRADIGPLYIDPNTVVHTISRYAGIGNTVWHFGTASAGDWDLDGYLVQERGQMYSILKQRIQEDAAYEQIPEFLRDVKRIEGGEFIHSSTTREEYYDRWHRIESLYWEIKKEGYKSQSELSTGNSLDEIRIQIGRAGELLLEEGRHRLLVAQLLGLDQVPVIVTRRHQEWHRLRQDIARISVKRGSFQQPFDHPDLDVIPKKYGNRLKDETIYRNEEWDFIENNLPVQNGTVLDIGACFGCFSRRFEGLGFECCAFESDRENLAVLKRYRQMMEGKFTVWEDPPLEIDRFDFDIVLALNGFQSLAYNRPGYERLAKFLANMRCQAMYFEPREDLQESSYGNVSDERFIEFVIGNSVLTHARCLGSTSENRKMYLLVA
jgi:hypothetical protein